jgi:hypothetical protein
MESSRSWEATSRSSIQEFSQRFKKPEYSLPFLQEPSTGSNPEPDQSSPYHPILFL